MNRFLLLVTTLASLLLPCRPHDGWDIQRVVLDVTDHGAVCDGVTEDTAAMRHILQSLAPSNSVVIIPKDCILYTGPLTIAQNNFTLLVQGTLKGLDISQQHILDQEWDRVAPLPTYGNSRDLNLYWQYQALIFAYNVTNFRITGSGTIDGNGHAWWEAYKNYHDRNGTVRLMAGRPNLIQIVNSSWIEMDSVHMRDSPFWTIHPVLCQHIHIHNVTIRAPLYSPNVDGIDPDSCRHVLIEHNDIACGDDHIAIKAGVCGVSSPNDCTNAVWTSGLYQTDNVTVRHNLFRTGMGVAVGSEMSGSVTNVLIHDNVMGLCETGHDEKKGCGWGPALHIKTTITRGGKIENVVFANNVVWNSTSFVLVEMMYQSKNEEPPPTKYPPTLVQNIVFANNSALGSAYGASFSCSRYDACQNVTLEANTVQRVIKGQSPWDCRYIASYLVRGNKPAGLNQCMKRSMINDTITGAPGNHHADDGYINPKV